MAAVAGERARVADSWMGDASATEAALACRAASSASTSSSRSGLSKRLSASVSLTALTAAGPAGYIMRVRTWPGDTRTFMIRSRRVAPVLTPRPAWTAAALCDGDVCGRAGRRRLRAWLRPSTPVRSRVGRAKRGRSWALAWRRWLAGMDVGCRRAFSLRVARDAAPAGSGLMVPAPPPKVEPSSECVEAMVF